VRVIRSRAAPLLRPAMIGRVVWTVADDTNAFVGINQVLACREQRYISVTEVLDPPGRAQLGLDFTVSQWSICAPNQQAYRVPESVG
jgi:hypothetical protein